MPLISGFVDKVCVKLPVEYEAVRILSFLDC